MSTPEKWYGERRYFAALDRLNRVCAGHTRRLNAMQNRRASKHARESHRIILRKYARQQREA